MSDAKTVAKKSVSELEVEASRAAEKAAAARRAVDEANRRAMQEREARLRAFDERWLESYRERDEALQRAEREAADGLVAALVESPVGRAYLRLRTAQQLRYYLGVELTGIRGRLGLPELRTPLPTGVGPSFLDRMERLLEAEASGLIDEELARASAEREAAAKGES
jgi:hypothetical protein